MLIFRCNGVFLMLLPTPPFTHLFHILLLYALQECICKPLHNSKTLNLYIFGYKLFCGCRYGFSWNVFLFFMLFQNKDINLFIPQALAIKILRFFSFLSPRISAKNKIIPSKHIAKFFGSIFRN
jgi:hypothetical protein